MAQRVSSAQILTRNTPSTTQYTSYKDMLVDLKPNPQTGVTSKTLRLIGVPVSFYEHSNKKRVEGEKGKTVAVDFPDKDFNKSFTRVCTENDPMYGECVWCKMGYVRSQRFAVNVIDREDGKVKVLSKGRTIFESFATHETTSKEANDELKAEAAANNEEVNPAELAVEFLGGEVAYDVRIKAAADAQALGGVKYTVGFATRKTRPNEKEIEALKSVRTISNEEIVELRSALPEEQRDAPDWIFYGYDLERIYRPSELRTEPRSTQKSEMTLKAAPVNTDDDDDDETPVRKTRTSKPAPAFEEDELPSPFSTDESADSTDKLMPW